MSCLSTVLFATIVIALVSTSSGQACNFNPSPGSAMVITTRTKLLSCFQTIPFDKKIALHTIAAMDYLVDMYSFTDLVFNSTLSGSPYHLTVDLARDLHMIKEKSTSADPLKQLSSSSLADLVDLFVQLRDAHTRYAAPLGYLSYQQKPFSLQAKIEQEEMRIYLAPPGKSNQASQDIVGNFQKYFNFDPSDYFGCRLLAIEGVEVVKSLKTFADEHVGTYKDQQVRFNALLRRGGFWELVNTIRYGLITPEKMTLSVSCEGTNGTKDISVPTYVAMGYNGTVSAERILEKNKPEKPKALSLQASEYSFDYVNPQEEFEDEQNHYHLLLTGVTLETALEMESFEAKKRIDQSAPRLVVQDESMNGDLTYMIYNDDVAILRLTTFAPVGKDDGETLNGTVFIDFLETTKRIYGDLNQRNISNLIMDVSRNGGGLICLAYDFLGSLVAEWNNYSKEYESLVWSLYDIRASHVTDLELGTGEGEQSSNANYGDPATRDYWEAVDDNPVPWYKPGVTLTRGGKLSKYSMKSLFPFSCGNPKVPLLDPPGWPKQKIPYVGGAIEKLIVLTDGTCGSACSLFTTKLQAHKKAYVVSYGGIYAGTKSTPMETSSFAGGNVLDFNQIYKDLGTLGLQSKVPLKPLPTSAYARFNSHETYVDTNDKEALDNALPREFLRLPADYHLFLWGAVWDNSVKLDGNEINPSLEELYAKVSPLFAEVPKGRLWETKKWEPPSVNKVPLMKMWTWVAVGAGVVVGLTILLVIILQYTRKKDGYEVISDE